MMAILGRDQVYMIDRDNAVFKISGLQEQVAIFPPAWKLELL